MGVVPHLTMDVYEPIGTSLRMIRIPAPQVPIRGGPWLTRAVVRTHQAFAVALLAEAAEVLGSARFDLRLAFTAAAAWPNLRTGLGAETPTCKAPRLLPLTAD